MQKWQFYTGKTTISCVCFRVSHKWNFANVIWNVVSANQRSPIENNSQNMHLAWNKSICFSAFSSFHMRTFVTRRHSNWIICQKTCETTFVCHVFSKLSTNTLRQWNRLHVDGKAPEQINLSLKSKRKHPDAAVAKLLSLSNRNQTDITVSTTMLQNSAAEITMLGWSTEHQLDAPLATCPHRLSTIMPCHLCKVHPKCECKCVGCQCGVVASCFPFRRLKRTLRAVYGYSSWLDGRISLWLAGMTLSHHSNGVSKNLATLCCDALESNSLLNNVYFLINRFSFSKLRLRAWPFIIHLKLRRRKRFRLNIRKLRFSRLDAHWSR